MEGCGWATDSARASLADLGGRTALLPLLQAEWTISNPEEEIGRLGIV